MKRNKKLLALLLSLCLLLSLSVPAFAEGEDEESDPSVETGTGEESGGEGEASGSEGEEPGGEGETGGEDGLIEIEHEPRKIPMDRIYLSPEEFHIDGYYAALADQALSQLSAPQSREAPPGSNAVDYNTWYYGTQTSVAPEKGGLPLFNWNAVFVCWCADQIGLTRRIGFPVTADAQALYDWLEAKDKRFVSAEELYYAPQGEAPVKRSDLVFFRPAHGALAVGIVTEVDENRGRVRAVMGDSCDSVLEISIDLRSSARGELVFVCPIEKGDDNMIFALARFLMKEVGLTKAAAAGVIANIYCESLFRPGILGDEGTSIGLCQWHDWRMDDLLLFCEKNALDPETEYAQLLYLRWELNERFSWLISRMNFYSNDARGAYFAADDFCQIYEKPTDEARHGDIRGNIAFNSIFPMLGRL